jgi:uncharacterized membrane protein YdbT with pleckstrin-like domain
MGIPAKLLADDEDVVLHLHTHWKALVRPTLVLLTASAAAAYVAAATPPGVLQPWMRVAALVIWAIIVIRWAVRPFSTWLSSTYTVTTHRIITRSGVFSRHGRDMPLSRINDVYFEHGIMDRLLGCGTLVVESAGERGQLVLVDVPRVKKVQLEIYRLHEEDDERRRWLPNDSYDEQPRRAYDDDDRRGGAVGATDSGW